MRVWWSVAVTILSVSSPLAASKPHVVVLGKWTTVKLQADDDNSAIDLKVRPLFVDGKTKEFTLGPHTKLPSAFSSYSECFASTIPCPRNPVQRAGVGKRAESSRERCPAPVWQRNPVRVTFATKEDPKLTVAVKSRSVEVASEDESEGEE